MREILSFGPGVPPAGIDAGEAGRAVDLDRRPPAAVARDRRPATHLAALALVAVIPALLTHQWDARSESERRNARVVLLAFVVPGVNGGVDDGRLTGEATLRLRNTGLRDVTVSAPAAHGTSYDLETPDDWRLLRSRPDWPAPA